MANSAKTYLLEEADRITKAAESAGRPLSAAETKTIESHLERVAEIDENEKMRAAINAGSTAQDLGSLTSALHGSSSSMADTLIASGWHPTTNPKSVLPLAKAIGVKDITAPAVTTWNVADPVVVPIGQDGRFLHDVLPKSDASTLSAVSDFKQTARTLTGTVRRTLDATTDKATVDVTLTHVVEALAQFAVVIDDVPNAILESVATARAFLDGEMRFQVRKAIDAHVVAQILAATPGAETGGSGTIDGLRYAVASMRDNGANPSVLVLDPVDAAALDLEVQPGDGGDYIFPLRDTGSSSPLWGLRMIEVAGMATHNPILIDPQMLGVLYLGTMAFDADPYTGFKKNLTTLRAECNALYHVRNVQGARILDAVS